MKNLLKSLVRILTALIPAKKLRKRVRTSFLFHLQKSEITKKLPHIRERQHELEVTLRQKRINGKRLRAAFLVCDVSMFTSEPIFKKLCRNSAYDPFIAIVPRVTRGEAFLRDTLQKTYDTLRERYGEKVHLFYDIEKKHAKSLSDLTDIVFTSIIYEEQSCSQYTVEAMSEYALVALISYGYSGLFKTNLAQTIFLPNIVYSWKYFLSNHETRNLWIAHNPQLLGNTIVSGYAKMDRLAEIKAQKPSGPLQKKIVIAPHHSLARDTDGLSLSNFMRFSDFFLSLPEKYPQISFVFRPHPLLFPRLATAAWWGEAKTSQYKKKMQSHFNVEFQQGGDYFDTFAKSSAIIHDCGSFLAEYFYTEMPQCYLIDNKTEAQFLPFGKKLLENVYTASTETQILDFIDKVVLAEEDPMKTQRIRFAQESVCVAYPNATGKIIDVISNILSTDKDI